MTRAGRAMSEQLERRVGPLTSLRLGQIRGAAQKIIGHAAVFDRLSEDLGGFRERVAPGAFTATLKSADILASFNHNPNLILGRNKSGTLRLKEDLTGLAVEIDVPETSIGRDAITAVKRGDVDQMSFGFHTVNDRWTKSDGGWIRTLLDVDLFDVSLATFAACSQTDATVRAFEAAKRGETLPGKEWRIALRRLRLDLER